MAMRGALSDGRLGRREDAAVVDFYRWQAPFYDITRQVTLHGREAALSRLNVERHHRVLEVGCGTGLHFTALRERLNEQRGSLLGVDLSPNMLAIARRRIARGGWTNVEAVEANATELDLGERFDRVFVSYCLSMIPNWERALSRITAHVRSGGRLIIVDFGDLAGFGRVAPLIRGWLALNHTTTGRPFARCMSHRGQVQVEQGWRGYYQIVSWDAPGFPWR
jgi:S-adenosylmethionine-diacylgycerolhomoserine-N-methlytransferase